MQTETPTKSWFRKTGPQPVRPRRGGIHAVILRKHGDGEVHAITGPRIETKEHGTYEVRHNARFWLERSLPRGFVTVYYEGNPEPINDQSPKGFTTLHVENMIGGITSRLTGNAFTMPFKLNRKWGIVVIVLIVTAAAGYWLWRRSLGS